MQLTVTTLAKKTAVAVLSGAAILGVAGTAFVHHPAGAQVRADGATTAAATPGSAAATGPDSNEWT